MQQSSYSLYGSMAATYGGIAPTCQWAVLSAGLLVLSALLAQEIVTDVKMLHASGGKTLKPLGLRVQTQLQPVV